jgi:hypothetical protein
MAGDSATAVAKGADAPVALALAVAVAVAGARGMRGIVWPALGRPCSTRGEWPRKERNHNT